MVGKKMLARLLITPFILQNPICWLWFPIASHARANLEVNEKQLIFLDILTQYQLEGRYPDYLRRLFHQTTERKAGEFIDQIKTIAQWLKDRI